MASSIDRQLVEALRQHGVDLSERSARRWREDGLLPETTRTSRGRAGATFTYPCDVIEHAIALKRLFQQGHDKPRVCVLVFVEGFEPRLRALRSAFGRIVVQVLGEPVDEAAAWARSEDRARRMARRAASSAVGREVKDRLRRGDQAGALGEILVHTLGVLTTGRGRLASETLVALNLDQSPFDTVSRANLSEPLSLLAPSRLLARVSQASLEDYREARATLRRLKAVVSAYARASHITGVHLGFRVLETTLAEDSVRVLSALLPLSLQGHPMGEALEYGLAGAEAEMPRFEALFSLADALPPDWRMYVGPFGPQILASEPQAHQKLVHAAVVAWADGNPTYAALLKSP